MEFSSGEDEVGHLANEARDHLIAGNCIHARDAANQLLQVARSSGNSDDQRVAERILDNVDFTETQFDSMRAAKENFASFLNAGDLDAASSSYLALCEAVSAISSKALATETCAEVENLCVQCNKAGATKAHATSLQGACIAFYTAGRYEEAISSSRKAAEFFESVGDGVSQAHALILNAEIRNALGAGLGIAKRAAEKAIKLLREAGHGCDSDMLRATLILCQVQVECLNEQPMHCIAEIRWGQVLKLARDAEEIARKLGDLSSAAMSLCLAVRVHLKNDKLQAAQRTVVAATAIYRDLGGSHGITRALLLCAEVFLRLGKIQEAKRFLSEASTLSVDARNEAAQAEAKIISDKISLALQNSGDVSATELTAIHPKIDGKELVLEALTFSDLLQNALAVDTLMASQRKTSLILPGMVSVFQPLDLEQFLALDRPNCQSQATLALLQTSEEIIAASRPSRMSMQTTSRRADQSADVAWVAPVRRRLESGVGWRPPVLKLGMASRYSYPGASALLLRSDQAERNIRR